MESKEVIEREDPDFFRVIPRRLREAYNRVEDTIGKYEEDQWVILGVQPKDTPLRLKFWKKVEICMAENKTLSMSSIYKGITTAQTFSVIVDSDVRAAYFFTRPLGHMYEAEVLLEKATDELAKILKLKMMDDEDKPIIGIVNAKIKVYKLLEDRVHGEAVKRIEEKKQVKITAEPLATPDKLANLDEELKRLEAETIDVVDYEVS